MSQAETAWYGRASAPHPIILLAVSSSNGWLHLQADSSHGHKLATAVSGITLRQDNVQWKNRRSSFLYLSLRMKKSIQTPPPQNGLLGDGFLRNVRVLFRKDEGEVIVEKVINKVWL